MTNKPYTSLHTNSTTANVKWLFGNPDTVAVTLKLMGNNIIN